MRIATLFRHATVLSAAAFVAACSLDSGGGSEDVAADGSITVDASYPIGHADGGVDTGLKTDGTIGADDAGGDGSIDPGDDANDLPDTPPPPIDAPIDAPADAPKDACTGAVEVCNDGVDNDCNGAVDCADSACNPTYACVAAAPAGWAPIEFAGSSRPACDPSFGTPSNVVEGPVAPAATCTCGCQVDPSNKGSCVHGTTHVTYANSTTTCGVTGTDFNSNDGACNAFGFAFQSLVGGKAQITALPYTPGACTSSVNKSVPPVSFAAQGRSCAPTAAFGAGCSASNVCAPKLSAAFAACVSKAGDQTCPSGFPTKHVVGTGVTDTRDCSACSCIVTGSCANPLFTDYQDAQCSVGGGGPDGGAGNKAMSTPADGQCDSNNETESAKYVAWRYSADVQNVVCAALVNSATGTTTLNGTKTICCQ